ncbi:MAG: L-fucose/L-arabinose isomerase family protein [Vicinamibacteraceae bacterium]|nr:L-fucose/L-arabinose isomerase family protein [Vicinamibacteraceae bacterium]
MTQPVTLGLIVGNRGFFPSHLCTTGRAEVMAALEGLGIRVVAVGENATPYGAIESLTSARICADHFKAHRDAIDGILVTLPNFGEERPIADTIRWAGLDVPVLVHAFADDGQRMDIENRRDSFCGKMSACNNLKQYGIPYSLTTLHTTPVGHPTFTSDIERFAAVCRVTRALKHARLGAIGARPAAFNTVRYSEKLLEQAGISVETLDLSELLGWANRMADSEPAVQEKLSSIHGYTSAKTVPTLSLMKMAKLGVAIDRFVAERQLQATAIQCWTALEEFYGVVPCTLMSMMSNRLMPSACETDVAGVVGMYILQAASGKPAALLDWNNNYGAHPDKGVVFHCSNLPRDFFLDQQMDYQAIIAGTVGRENTYGTIVGRVKPGPFTFCRISTDDQRGIISGYVGEGRFTEDAVETFGGYGVVEVPEFQHLLQFICREGFEHHVAATRAEVASAIDEALTTYKGWDIYRHG